MPWLGSGAADDLRVKGARHAERAADVIIYMDTDSIPRGGPAPGEGLLFGNYPQGTVLYPDGKRVARLEPVIWRVLDVTDGKVLLLSERVLDARVYDSGGSVWKESELRAWLDSAFVNMAFSAGERTRLDTADGDRVTLLTPADAVKYLGSTKGTTGDGYPSYPGRTARFTPYAEAAAGSDGRRWWLRPSRAADADAEYIDHRGVIYHSEPGAIRDRGGVRPVISLRL